MKKQRSLIVLLLILSSMYRVQAQQQLAGGTADSKVLPGGTSLNTGMGSLYSPNLYDGTANISIPIYQYSADKLDFGISLNYNTKGVMVDETPSETGLHWQLNRGASITRVVKDLADEMNLLDGDTTQYVRYYNALGWLPQLPGIGNIADSVHAFPLNSFWALKGKFTSYYESASSKLDSTIYRDKEADDFTVNLSGSTFTFNLGKDGTFFTKPHRNVKIEVLWDGQIWTPSSDLQPVGHTVPKLGFRVTDEQGNQYTFIPTKAEKAHRIEDMYGNTSVIVMCNYATKWVISDVKLANGRMITYNYDFSPLSDSWFQIAAPTTYSVLEGTGSIYSGEENISTTAIERQDAKLTSIQYPNNVTVYLKYESIYKPNDGTLKEIRVTTPQNCLSYGLQQSNVVYRNVLNSITISSCDGTVTEPYYSFDYNTLNLPPRSSIQQDFFGYFNDKQFTQVPTGQTYTPNMIPKHKFLYGYYVNGVLSSYHNEIPIFMDRTSDGAKMQAGVLKSINNAYGGKITFYYSANDCTNQQANLPLNDSFFLAQGANDGLRVDSIVESEKFHLENAKVTAFTYTGGQLFMDGGYFHIPTTNFCDYTYGSLHDSTQYMRYITMTSQFMTPHQLVNGSNHGYSHVSVLTKTGDGLQLSRKEVDFTNYKNGTVSNYFVIKGGKDYYTFPYTDKQYLMDWKMGLPLQIAEYDQNDRIVQKTINKYLFTIDTTSSIGKVENEKICYVPSWGWEDPNGAWHPIGYHDTYRPYCGTALLDTTIINKYISDNAFIADTVSYAYDNHNNLTTTATTNSKGEHINTVQAYNYNITALPGSALYDMNAAGLEKMIGTERWMMGGGGATTNTLLDAYYNSYNNQNGSFYPKRMYNLYVGQPLTYSQYTGYTGGGALPPAFGPAASAFVGSAIPNFRKTSEVTQTDAFGNPTETQMLGQAIYKSMVWDNDYGQKIAECNAPLQDIAFSGFDATTHGGWTYNSLGSTQVTGAVTGRGAYLFGSNGPITKSIVSTDKNFILAFWASNYNAAPNCSFNGTAIALVPGAVKGNWTYYEGTFTSAGSAATLSISGASNSFVDELRLFPANSGMQTWTYEPLFGISATSSINGRLTYFEYDKLGRQSIVRDQEGNIRSKTENHLTQ